MKEIVRYVNVSGGKDSTAILTLAVERAMKRDIPFIPVFANVGNEAPATLDYIRALPAKVGCPEIVEVQADLSERVLTKALNLPVAWAKRGISQERIDRAVELLKPTGNPFLDACLARGGFPSHERRFCTDLLKIKPLSQLYKAEIEAGKQVISWIGIRAQESAKRSLLPRHSKVKVYGAKYHMFYPILRWTLEQVIDQVARHGVKLNPLYALGAERVGCFPCIFVQKKELRMLAGIDPSALERVEAWELLVSEVTPRGIGTFLPPNLLHKPGPITPVTHGIKEHAKWAKTSRGGRQYDFDNFRDRTSQVEKEWSETCGTYGVCE